MKYLKLMLIASILAIPLGVAASQTSKKVYSTEYYLEGENNKEYPYKSDIQKEIISDKTYDEKEEKPNRTFIEVNSYKYQPLAKINRINIRQISDNDFNIKNIKVYAKGEKLNYKYICSDCFGYSIATFEKEFTYDIDNRIKKTSYMDIVLDKHYNPLDLKLEVTYENKENNNLKSIDIVYYDYDKDNRYMVKPTIKPDEFIIFHINDISSNKTVLTLKKENINKIAYDNEIITSDKKLDENFYKLVEVSTKYKYVDRVYLYYKLDYEKKEGDTKQKANQNLVKKLESKNSKSNNSTANKLINTPKVNKSTTSEKNNTNQESKKISTIKETEINMTDKKQPKRSGIYKFQHLFLVIIVIILLLMGYTFYNLKKE